MLTRRGEAGAHAFTIMRIARHSSVTVSQRYVHPTPEGMERAFQRMERLNAAKVADVEAERLAEAAGTSRVRTKIPTGKPAESINLSKLLNLNVRALSSAVRAADS